MSGMRTRKYSSESVGNHHLLIGLLLGAPQLRSSASRLVKYHHLGDEGLNVSDVFLTPTCRERAKVLVGVASEVSAYDLSRLSRTLLGIGLTSSAPGNAALRSVSSH